MKNSTHPQIGLSLACAITLILGGTANASKPHKDGITPNHQSNPSWPDTIVISVEGKDLSLARTHQYDDLVIYETWEHFTEHGKNYIYRALEYSLIEGHYQCDTSSYFILSHLKRHGDTPRKGHLRDIERISCFNFWPAAVADDTSFIASYRDNIYQDIKKAVPTLKQFHLGDMPRRWYHLSRYNDAYYFSIDQDNTQEFNDSLLIFYSQELSYCALDDFCRLKSGGWAYTYILWDGKRIKETIVPCKRLKGAYIITTEEPGQPPQKSLWAPEKNITDFDAIDYESTSHIPLGLEQYQEIDSNAI